MKFIAEGRRIIRDHEHIERDGKRYMTMAWPVAEVSEHMRDPEGIARAIAELMTNSTAFQDGANK